MVNYQKGVVVDTNADILLIHKYLSDTADDDAKEAFNRIIEKIYECSGDSRELFLLKRMQDNE
jgi:hypothetical protein